MKRFSFLSITILQIFIWNLLYWVSYNWLGEAKDFSQDPKYEWYWNNAIFNEIFTMDGALCSLETINWESALKESGNHYIFSIVNKGRLTDFFWDCYEYGWEMQFTRNWEFLINIDIKRKDWVYEKKWEKYCEEELLFYNNLFWSLLSWGTYIFYPKVIDNGWMYRSNIELIDRLWNVFLRNCSNERHEIDKPVYDNIEPIVSWTEKESNLPENNPTWIFNNFINMTRWNIGFLIFIFLLISIISIYFYLKSIKKSEENNEWWESF